MHVPAADDRAGANHAVVGFAATGAVAAEFGEDELGRRQLAGILVRADGPVTVSTGLSTGSTSIKSMFA